MKPLRFYKDTLNCYTDEDVFSFLISELKETIKSWDYFVNWEKVKNNVALIEVELNILNTLVGKDNPKNLFVNLVQQYPTILTALPVLIAMRDTNLILLNPQEEDIFNFDTYTFKKRSAISLPEAEQYADFLEKTGFFKLIQDKSIKSLVDYVTGVEVGLDSNGRKNRSGTNMENLTELFVKKVCDEFQYPYIVQATANEIKRQFNEVVTVEKNDRRFDFAIKTDKKIILIETNYYGGGGSKLKATAGEYKALHDYTKQYNPHCEFVWITDGKGWLTAKNPLRETFNHIDYIFNLEMLQRGALKEMIAHS
ncbi:MAG: type II restriction endonuclease [Ectobacillus sp.]